MHPVPTVFPPSSAAVQVTESIFCLLHIFTLYGTHLRRQRHIRRFAQMQNTEIPNIIPFGISVFFRLSP